MDVFCCWDGDKIGRRVGRAVLADDVGEVRRVDQAINAGNELWRSLAVNVGGSVIEVGGDEGRIVIDASRLSDMPAVAEQYAETVGATVSVGVGTKLSDSAKALVVAKLRGGDKIVIWDDEMQPEYEAATKPKTEQEKISDEYLQKDEKPKRAEETGHSAVGAHSSNKVGENHGPNAGFEILHKPGFTTVKPSDEPAPAAPPPSLDPTAAPAGPSLGSSSGSPEDDLHAAAQDQGAQDLQGQYQSLMDQDQLKKMVTDCLTKVRKQLPAISKLQQTSPDAYKSILGLVQGVILMGKALTGGEQDPQQPQGDPDPQYVQDMGKNEMQSTPPANGEMGMAESSQNDVEDVDDASLLKDDSIPDGTVVNQKMKVRHSDGSASWKSMESGMIASQDAGSGPFGANSHPTSSREPSAR
jgi:hypothetical protein